MGGIPQTEGSYREREDNMVCRCGHISGVHAKSGQCKVCDCRVFMIEGSDKERQSLGPHE